MRAGQGAEKTVMRRWVAETKLHRGRLNEGQKEAVKTILASKDRVLGIQGLRRDGEDDDAEAAAGARREPGLADNGH